MLEIVPMLALDTSLCVDLISAEHSVSFRRRLLSYQLPSTIVFTAGIADQVNSNDLFWIQRAPHFQCPRLPTP